MDALLARMSELLSAGKRTHEVRVPLEAGEAIAWLHNHGEVVEEGVEDSAMRLLVRLSDADWARFRARAVAVSR